MAYDVTLITGDGTGPELAEALEEKGYDYLIKDKAQ